MTTLPLIEPKKPSLLGCKFQNSKVIIISDIHIGNNQSNAIFHNIAIEFAKWLRQEAINNNINDIIVSGDIFNNRHEISVPTINTAHQFFSILNIFNIFALVGNHDAYYKDRSDINSINILDGRDNIKIIKDPLIIEQFNKKIAFAPWGSTLDFITDKVDYLFGHLETKTFKMTKYEECTHGYNSSELLDKATNIFSGHLHLRQERTYDNGKIVYVGNPFQLNWGDYEVDKGYHILDFKDNSLSFIKNTISPIHIKFYLSKILDKGLTPEDKQLFKNNIIKLVIDTEIDQETIELLYNKLILLKPLDLKLDLINFNNKIYNNDETNLKLDDTVDFSLILKEYISNLDVDYKDNIYEYIINIYNKFKEGNK